MAEKNDAKDRFKADYYAKLLIYRARKVALGVLMLLGTITLTMFIHRHRIDGSDWIQMLFPVCGFGMLYLLFPVTERWHYAPWQTASQRVERNIKD